MIMKSFDITGCATLNLARSAIVLILLFCCPCTEIRAQTTVVTFQGKLKDGGTQPTGQYDFTFKLYDLLSGGNQIGGDVVRNDVQVTEGVFTVDIDFGSSPFTSDIARFLEISVRLGTSAGGYTVLLPRQPLTSSPYSVTSLNAANALNAAQLGGVVANQFVLTADPRLTDDRNPLANSPNYVRNSTIQQALSNFNVSGTGIADIFDASTQYNLGGSRILGAGSSNTTGSLNSFFGTGTGQSTTTGSENSFFGYGAGFFNQSGCCNSFFGRSAGQFNKADLGLVAEDVVAVEPLLTTVNEKGEIEGVKYDRVGVVLINAVREQQTQIEAQARQIGEQKALIRRQQENADKQQAEINALKSLVCLQNPTAEICEPKEK